MLQSQGKSLRRRSAVIVTLIALVCLAAALVFQTKGQPDIPSVAKVESPIPGNIMDTRVTPPERPAEGGNLTETIDDELERAADETLRKVSAVDPATFFPTSPGLIERRKVSAIEVETESIRESIDNLPTKTQFELGMKPAIFPDGYLEHIATDPRVARLLSVIKEGTLDEHSELKSHLLEAQSRMLDLPAYAKNMDEGWQPTILSQGGGQAYSLLLMHVDENGDTLPALVSMFKQIVAAARQDLLDKGVEVKGSIDGGSHGIVLAFACDSILTRLYDTGQNLSADQKEILKGYNTYRENRGTKMTDWDYSRESVAVLDWATQYVEQ